MLTDDLGNTVPAPAHGTAAADGNADTDDGADDSVRGRDGHAVERGDCQPRRRADGDAGEGEEDDAGILVEDADVDDVVA
jgi:hypothetical protein